MEKIKEKIKGKINMSKIINIVIILGIVLRILYISYTNYDVRQHDIEPEIGHIAYIMHIYENGNLPESNTWQFYHPPLHHIISAAWLKALSFTFLDNNQIMEVLQILPCIYSILMIFVSKKILEEMNLEEKYKLPAIMIMSFHPTLILLSGSINNDCLALLLMICVIWYMIKWKNKLLNYFDTINFKDNKKSWKELVITTIIFAIFMGCAVMTKLNSAIVAVPVAVYFIWKFFEYFTNKEKIKKYILILGIFGIVSLPLGLWYPIRNYIKFEQNLTYVPTPGFKGKCSNYTILERFLTISKDDLINNTFCNLNTEYNLPTFLIKSSLFGEYSYYNINIANMAKFANVLIIALVIISIIKNVLFLKKKEMRFERIFFLLVQMVSIAFFVYFNIKMPYAPTMDFRYIAITLLSGGVLMALDLKESKNQDYKYIVYVFTIIFSILSILLYTIK